MRGCPARSVSDSPAASAAGSPASTSGESGRRWKSVALRKPGAAVRWFVSVIAPAPESVEGVPL